ncbi:winged helix-turn-helix domain-containing protein [Falsiroseomonas sp. HW251]|uniref:winged helix-turn-helix domain-containing protein n=1 Tax=Falsiroseomonas sp. HW251 TaxID=3390998 RepID=UPI003D310B67
MATRILIADHHAEDGEALAAFLTRQGLGTECWNAGDALLQRLAVQPPALVLLHRRVRTEPDLTVLRRLRAASSVPVMLRAMDGDDEVDRVLALEIGADDYLRQDTGPREVLARIRTVLRRVRIVPPRDDARGGWRLCLRQRELFAPDGRARHLTSAEFELLQSLARQQGMPVHRDALSLSVLRRPYHPEDRALDNIVLRLRRKLGDEGAAARLIKSVRGIGYVFVGFDVVTGMPPVAANEAAAEMAIAS